MKHKVHFINKISYIIIVIWSFFILSITGLKVLSHYSSAQDLAKHEATVSVKKDLAYRSWVSSHGGIYVPITQRTPPNPYLSHIKNRDVNTSSGERLTLMNPAYTLSQMMKDYSELYGSKGHITSRILMNPKNAPDEWEKKALETSVKTKKPTFVQEKIDDEEYFRYLVPMVTTESCLKCHAFQGYEVGDIRGGVSVSIPMEPYNKRAFEASRIDVIINALIYIIGLVVIYYIRNKIKSFLDAKIKDYEQHIFSLVDILERRDSYTAGHTQRVAKYSVLIAKQMGLSKEETQTLYRACMLHDIGKISTPDSILLKPGKLNALEYEIIKEHVVVSYELLAKVDIYKEIADIVRHHHEHYDGTGYPQGLKGDEIPKLSQILTVADSFDAMTTNRVYKTRKTLKAALEELKSLRSLQFSKDVVDAAVIALKDVKFDVEVNQRPQTKIEKERFSYFYRDLLTSVYNRDYLEYVLAFNNTEQFTLEYAYVFYLHNFSLFNKNNSWVKGDELLKKFAESLEDLNDEKFVFRVYGDDFVVLSKKQIDVEKNRETLSEVLTETGVSFSYKVFHLHDENIRHLKDLEKRL